MILQLLIALATCSATASTLESSGVKVSSISSNSSNVRVPANIILSPGTSLRLEGAAGQIEAASTATASTFYGDGTNMTGVALPTSTQTFSGAKTFQSSMTATTNGRAIVLSTSTTSDNLHIDGDGALSLIPEFHNTTFTTISAYSTSATSLGVCVAGSTLTLTTSGGRIELSFDGSLIGDGSTREMLIGFLQDGEFPAGQSSTIGALRRKSQSNSSSQSFSYLLAAPAAGSHSFCLTIANNTGSISLSNSAVTGDSMVIGSRNIFIAKEIK